MIAITDKEFDQISTYVKSNYGLNLENKKTLVVGRLQNYLAQNNFKSFSDYYDFIISDKAGHASVNLLNKLTTNHTFFLREKEHFSFLEESILPYLELSCMGEKDMRIWSAGCSSGQEPYTIAMIIDNYFGKRKGMWDTKILATDISSNVLEKAINGVYLEEDIRQIPDRFHKYFRQISKEKYITAESIKKEVIFKRFNLMETYFPFKKKFHVIFCRNVMIYFDQRTKIDLVNRFYECTESGGYLFIGHSESLDRNETKYKYVMPAVYRKE